MSFRLPWKYQGSTSFLKPIPLVLPQPWSWAQGYGHMSQHHQPFDKGISTLVLGLMFLEFKKFLNKHFFGIVKLESDSFVFAKLPFHCWM